MWIFVFYINIYRPSDCHFRQKSDPLILSMILLLATVYAGGDCILPLILITSCIVSASRDKIWYCTVLHYTTPHCTTLHGTALHCTALQYSALHFTALQWAALYCNAQHWTEMHCTALQCSAEHWPKGCAISRLNWLSDWVKWIHTGLQLFVLAWITNKQN